MGTARESGLVARMLAMRALVGALAATGDPMARVLGRRALADPYPAYERIRARGPVSKHVVGLHIAASHGAAKSILRDPRFEVEPAADHVGVDWNIRPGDERILVHPMEQSILTMNPPRHTELRRLVAPWFSPKALRERRSHIERMVDERLDELPRGGPFDLVEDFAIRVPISVICALLGLPEAEHRRFVRWGTTLTGTLDGIRTLAERRRVRTVVAEMTHYFGALLAQRTRDPGDDLISALLQVEVAGRPLAARDIIGLVGLILVAGFDTTVNLIAGGTYALLRHPEQCRLFMDEPERATDAVNEVLRYETPVQFTLRVPREPVSLHGVDVPSNAMTVVLLAAANRDPEVFAQPHRFDITRPNSHEHLAFSAGIHYCLGAGLARVEAEVAICRLLQRFPRLTLAGSVRYRRTRNIRGPLVLPVHPSLAPVTKSVQGLR